MDNQMCDFYPFQSCICTCVKGLKLWTSKIAQGWEPWAPVTLHMHLDSHMGTLHWHLGWVTDKTIMKFQLPPGSCCDTIVGVIASNTDSKSSIDNSFIIFIFFYQNRNKIVLIFFKWAIPGLFFFIFVFSIKLTVNVQYYFLSMTGFKPWSSGVGIKHSTNWVATIARNKIVAEGSNHGVPDV